LSLVSKKYSNLNRTKELVTVLALTELSGKYGKNLPIIGGLLESQRLPLRAYIVNELGGMMVDKYELDKVSMKLLGAFDA
jgi:hypothetical protein